MSFDRVASIYDATRGLPDGLPERVADTILAVTHARPDTRFLELGIGTGRVALPIITLGYPYIGVDISDEMMGVLRNKLPKDTTNLQLIEADVTELPLPSASVDVALNAHVLHLVPEWKKALDEVERVLAPGGYFVQSTDDWMANHPLEDLRNQWRLFVEETGTELRPSYGTWRAVEAELVRRGAKIAILRVAVWDHEFRPVDLLEEQRNRTFSLSWTVPDDVLESVNERMLGYAQERYGDLTKSLTSSSELMLSVARFPS